MHSYIYTYKQTQRAARRRIRHSITVGIRWTFPIWCVWRWGRRAAYTSHSMACNSNEGGVADTACVATCCGCMMWYLMAATCVCVYVVCVSVCVCHVYIYTYYGSKTRGAYLAPTHELRRRTYSKLIYFRAPRISIWSEFFHPFLDMFFQTVS